MECLRIRNADETKRTSGLRSLCAFLVTSYFKRGFNTSRN